VGSLFVAAFHDEATACAGAKILRDLHARGTLTLYAMAILGHKPNAGLFVHAPVEHGAAVAAPGVGATVGALVTLLGGPLTIASRTVTSGLVGAVQDLGVAGLDAAFFGRISRQFHAGGSAIIAEAEEEEQLSLDARIQVQGGRIFRHRLLGTLAEERVIRELEALLCELRRLRTEPGKDVGAEAGARVRQDRVLELQHQAERTHALAQALRNEAAAKVAVLRAQAAQLEGAARQAVERRATLVRSSLEARAARLDRVVEGIALPQSDPMRAVRSPSDQTGDY
jgi:hypothetical protein